MPGRGKPVAGSDARARVLIALTESSPVNELWEAALARLGQSGADLVALFLAEDHWQRAASLPFTREIPRLGGADVEFTLQRARQLHDEAIERARRVVAELATEAKLSHAFEVLRESDRTKLAELLSAAGSVLIAPSFIIKRPLYAELQKLDCRIELIEVSRSASAKVTAKGKPR